MIKVEITSLEKMSEDRIMEDIAMTPIERLHLVSQLSEFAMIIRAQNPLIEEEPSSIQWIEVGKISF